MCKPGAERKICNWLSLIIPRQIRSLPSYLRELLPELQRQGGGGGGERCSHISRPLRRRRAPRLPPPATGIPRLAAEVVEQVYHCGAWAVSRPTPHNDTPAHAPRVTVTVTVTTTTAATTTTRAGTVAGTTLCGRAIPVRAQGGMHQKRRRANEADGGGWAPRHGGSGARAGCNRNPRSMRRRRVASHARQRSTAKRHRARRRGVQYSRRHNRSRRRGRTGGQAWYRNVTYPAGAARSSLARGQLIGGGPQPSRRARRGGRRNAARCQAG